MADNITANPGTGGDTIAADDIAGVKHQRVKISQGADGTAVDVSAAAPLQVSLANHGANATAVKVDNSAVTQPVSIATNTPVGNVAHDAVDSGAPMKVGGYAKAAAPTDVSADADRVNAWFLLNGAQAVNVTAAGALIGGDAANGLDVDVTRSALPSGASTSAKQDTGNTSLSSIDGKITAVNTGAVVVASGSITANAGTNLNTSALATEATLAGAIKAEDAASASADKGVPALAIQTATPADTAGTDLDYSMLQMAGGRLWVDASGKTLTVASHAVTNAGTFAVQATEADGANTTLGAKADAKSTATDTTAITIMSVLKQISASVQAPPSQAVTNAGTFAVQSAATLSAETTKVIGTVRTADGAGNLYTTNSSTYTAKFAQDGNLLGTLGTAFSTAGKVDVKGADGDVFVRQATGSNLHTVLDSGTLTTLTTLTGTTTLTPGTGATNLGKAEDAVHSSGDVGVMALGVRDDTLTINSGAEGDYEPFHTTADGAIWVAQIPSTTGGWSTFNATSGDGSTALTSTAQQVKATAGTVGGWYIYNPNATATYVNFYNLTSANTTVGTSNQQMVICIPATSGANVEFGNGITFATAITISATTTGGGNTAPSTALECNVYFK